MNWNAAEAVAEVAAAEYDLCIASDVAYTAVQLLHRPTLSATPSPHTLSSPTLSRSSPHTRSSPTLSRSPTTPRTSRPSQPRCALSGLPPPSSSRRCTGEAHMRARARTPRACAGLVSLGRLRWHGECVLRVGRAAVTPALSHRCAGRPRRRCPMRCSPSAARLPNSSSASSAATPMGGLRAGEKGATRAPSSYTRRLRTECRPSHIAC